MKPHKIPAGGACGAALQVRLSCCHPWDKQGHSPCWLFPSTSNSPSSLLSLRSTVGSHPQPWGVLFFNSCVFIFAIAQIIPDPALSPALFDPRVSGVQSGTFHSLPPLNSFRAARPLKPGAICQSQRVLINTEGPRPCDLATRPKKGRGQSPGLAMFSLQGLLEGEGELFFLAFFLSFFSQTQPSWDTPGCLSPPLPHLMTASSRTIKIRRTDEINQKNQEHILL